MSDPTPPVSVEETKPVPTAEAKPVPVAETKPVPVDAAGNIPPGTNVLTVHEEHSEEHVWAGPLPTPEDLAKFEQVLPGLADRIMKQAEAEQLARHRREERMFEDRAAVRATEASLHTKGLLVAIGIVVLLVAGSVTCAIFNHPFPATVFAGSSLAQVFRSLLIDWRKKPNDPPASR